MDKHIERALNEVDINRLPKAIQRAAENLSHHWAEREGFTRHEHLMLEGLCSDCRAQCSNECECWCHGNAD